MNANQPTRAVDGDEAALPAFNFKPLYFLSFSGDFILSTMIVACVLSGTKAGVPGSMIGIIGAAYGITYMFSPVLFGRLSDRFGRKRSLVASMAGICILGFVFLAFYAEIVVLVFGQLAAGMLYGLFWPSIEAYTSQSSTSSSHQKSINNFCISWSLGYMLGPFVAPILDDVGSMFSFLLMACLSLVNLVVIVSLLPRIETMKATRSTFSGTAHEAMVSRKSYWITTSLLVCVIFTYAFSKAFLVGVYPDVAKNPDYLGWSGVQAGAVFFCFGGSRTITFIVQNRMKNQGLFSRVLVSFLLGCCCFLFVLTEDFFLTCIFFAITGVFSGLVYTMTLEKLLTISRDGKGQAAGLFEGCIGLGNLISPLLGGFVLELANPSMAFVATGLACVAASAVSLFLYIVYRARACLSRDSGQCP
nr:MFS transporter [Candidatus Sigynarchaeota archaeon]